MSLSRFLFILFEFFLNIVARKPYTKMHTGALWIEATSPQDTVQGQSWRATQQHRTTLAVGLQSARSLNPFVNMGLIPAALIGITDFSVSACVRKE